MASIYTRPRATGLSVFEVHFRTPDKRQSTRTFQTRQEAEVFAATFPPTTRSLTDRLAAGLERKPNGCLEWTKGTDSDGYDQIMVDGKMVRVHRLAWSLAHPDEPLPPVVRHYVCDNPPCADAAHLRPGTQAQNMADRARNTTHCPADHEYTKANTYLRPDGSRDCKTCNRAAVARYKTKKAEDAAS